MKLNEHQRAASYSEAKRLRILAGAGTGKTTVLVERALWLAGECDLVRLVTFTRRAARVLRERIQAEAHDGLADRIAVSTHHGLAAELLREHGDVIGWREGWRIIDRVEEEALRQEAGRQLDLVEARLQRHGLRRYDELLPGAVRLLESDPRLLEMITEGTELLVDEAHDSSPLEWRLDELLGRCGLTVVGDAAQRIYGWRGAQPLEDAPGPWETVKLPVCYRCAPEILSVANRLPIPGRIDLLPRDGAAEGYAGVWEERSDEEIVAHLLRTPGFVESPERWAILGRTNRRLQQVAEQLASAGVPVHCPSLEATAWETPEARLVIDLLHVLAHEDDSLHLGRVLVAMCGWTDADLLLAEMACASRGGPGGLSEYVAQRSVEKGDPMRVNSLRYRFGDAMLAADGQDAVRCVMAPNVPAVVGRLPGCLSEVELLEWLADPNRDEQDEGEQEACHVGTIHTAKGAEWDRVLVLGLEEGGLPGARWRTEERDEEQRIAEERRLLYVAITRARERVVLARRTGKWTRGRGWVDVEPSRFLEEV